MFFVDTIKKIISEISSRHKFVHGKKGNLENWHKQLQNWKPDGTLGKTGRVVGLGGIDLSWLLFCLGKYTLKDLNTVFMDNAIIDKLKNKKAHPDIKISDSEFKKFFKKLQKSHPAAAARLHLWMVYALLTTMVVGGVEINEHSDDIKQYINGMFPRDKKYNISDKDFKNNFVNENWSEIVIGLLEFETYYDKPVLQDGEIRCTYCAGVTWVYIDGKQYPCIGDYAKMAENFSDKEKWEQIRRHCLYPGECLDRVQNHMMENGFTEVSDNQVLGLLFAGYQIPGTSGSIIKRVAQAGDDKQKIADAFMAGGEVKQKYRKGTNKRRWWCALYYLGIIDANDFLDMDRDAFSEININTIIKNGHFVLDESVVEYALSLKNGKGSVRDFIKSHDALSNVRVGKTFKFKPKVDEKENPSMNELKIADEYFKSKKYQKAITHYEKAIDLDANNMEAYSSLTLAYKKLGDETHNISDYEKSLETVRRCNAQMNANKSLLYDPDVKAATYFNAGLAREEMAKLQESNNIKDAIDNYTKALKNFETALENAKVSDNQERIKIYKNAIKRVSEKIKSLNGKTNKVMAFNDGIRNIKIKQNQKNNDMFYKFGTEHQA